MVKATIFELISSSKLKLPKGSFFDGAVMVECVRQDQGKPGHRKDRVIVQFSRPGKYEVSFSKTASSRRATLPKRFLAIVDGSPLEKVIEYDHLPSALGVEVVVGGKLEKHYL